MDASDVARTSRGILVRGEDGTWAAPNSVAQELEATLALLGAVFKAPGPSPEFVKTVESYLEPMRDKFNYPQMLHTYLSSDRFRKWVEVVCYYRDVRDTAVLASGCGVGGSLVEWWAAGASKVTGLEIDPAIVDMANLRVAGLEGVSAHLYDGGRLPLAEAEFDIVESFDVLEHVPHPDLYIAELHRVLKPGGVVLLVTPNRLFPMEQHVNVPLAPWLPLQVANRWSAGLAPKVRNVLPDFSWRLERLPTVREFNVSHRRLRSLAKAQGFYMERLDPRNHPTTWPLPPSPMGADRFVVHPLGKFVTPTRHIVALLRKER